MLVFQATHAGARLEHDQVYDPTTLGCFLKCGLYKDLLHVERILSTSETLLAAMLTFFRLGPCKRFEVARTPKQRRADSNLTRDLNARIKPTSHEW